MEAHLVFLVVLSAFFVFAVLLPLLGIVIGLFCYYVLPYLFGGLVMLALLLLVGVKFLMTWWVWVLSVFWAAAVWLIKVLFRNLGEEIEHYRAAHVTLLLGAPYRRRRKELRSDFAVEIE